MGGACGDIKDSPCLKQGAQKEPETREFDELKRTLQYVEASRASATKHMIFSSSLLVLLCH